MGVLLVLLNEEMDCKTGQDRIEPDGPAPWGLAALLETLGQELLGAVGPLLFLLLNLAEEAGEILIATSIAGIGLVEVRTLQGVIQNADKIVGGVFGAGVIGHGSVSCGLKTLAQSLAPTKVPIRPVTQRGSEGKQGRISG